jgi:hypothetical protein
VGHAFTVAELTLAACAAMTDAETAASAKTDAEVRTSQFVDQSETGAASNGVAAGRCERTAGQVCHE